MFLSAEDNKTMYQKWLKIGEKLKKLRQQIVKSQVFAFAFDKVGIYRCIRTVKYICMFTKFCCRGIIYTCNLTLCLVCVFLTREC